MKTTETDDIRQASPRKMNRRSLALSLPLAILVLGAIVFWFVR